MRSDRIEIEKESKKSELQKFFEKTTIRSFDSSSLLSIKTSLEGGNTAAEQYLKINLWDPIEVIGEGGFST